MRLAEIIQDEAERTLADPATIRRELEQIEQSRASGEVSDEEAAELEKEALARFTRLRRGGTAAAGGGGEGLPAWQSDAGAAAVRPMTAIPEGGGRAGIGRRPP